MTPTAGTGTLGHPADRGDTDARGRFDRLAERGSFLASSPLFFCLCIIVVAVWAVGLTVGASDRFEAAGAGLMSAMTLLLVAMLKNAELRAERAIQRKLDCVCPTQRERQASACKPAISRKRSGFTTKSDAGGTPSRLT